MNGMVPCLTAQEEEKERHMMDAGSGVCGCLAVLCSTTTGIKMLQKKEKKNMQTRHVPETFCLSFLFFVFLRMDATCGKMDLGGTHREGVAGGTLTSRRSGCASQ